MFVVAGKSAGDKIPRTVKRLEVELESVHCCVQLTHPRSAGCLVGMSLNEDVESKCKLFGNSGGGVRGLANAGTGEVAGVASKGVVPAAESNGSRACRCRV